MNDAELLAEAEWERSKEWCQSGAIDDAGTCVYTYRGHTYTRDEGSDTLVRDDGVAYEWSRAYRAWLRAR